MSLTVTAAQTAGTSIGIQVQVMVLTGAKTVASQTGGTASIAGASPNQVSLTTTQTGSRVYGASSAGASNTALATTTFITDFHDTPNQEFYTSWRASSVTGTPGAATYGSSSASLFPDIAAVEILTTGTLAEDASAPAVANTTSATTITTAAFTPVAGSLLVALVGSDGAAGGTPTTVSVSDTSGLTWTQVKFANSGTTCYAGVWLADVPGGGALYTGTNGLLGTQAIPGFAQPGNSIPGQVQPSIVTHNGNLVLAATAHASFGGTKTGLTHLTTAATAHTTLAGKVTEFGHFTSAITAHLTAAAQVTEHGFLTAAATARAAFAGTKTGLSHLTTAVTAHAAFTGTKAALGNLVTAATAHASFTGVRTTLGTFTSAVTAHLTTAGTKTGLAHLTTSATAVMTSAASTAKNAALNTAVTARATVAGTKTALSSLTTAVSARMTAAAHVTEHGSFTAAATAAMTAAAHVTEHGALAAAATARAAFSGTKTGLSHFTTAITAHDSFAGTKTAFGTFTSSVTAHLTAAAHATEHGFLTTAATARAAFNGTKTALGHLNPAAVARFVINGVTHFLRPPANLGGSVIRQLFSGTESEVANQYGGTLTLPTFGGGLVLPNTGGTAGIVANVLGGTISPPALGGTLGMTNFGGGAVGWTMQEVDQVFPEFNDITLNVSLTSNGSALNLTGYTVKMLLKPSAGVLDSDGRNIILSSAGGTPAITIVSAPAGTCNIAIANADVQDQVHTFYRIDAVDGSGNINTCIYGTVTYTPL